MKVYVTGASGRVGKELMQALPDATPLVRRDCGLAHEIVTDFQLSSLEEILKDADVVIHLAGSRDFLDERKAWEGNVELTRNIVEAMPQSTRIIYSSSISVYGKKLAKIPADENSEVHPDTPYAKTKLEAEKIVAAHPDYVILRIGPVYGPGFEEYFSTLRMMEKGRMSIIGKGDNRIPFVHVSDVVDAMINAMAEGSGVYVIVGESLSQRKVYEIAARELGVKSPDKHTPVFLAMAFAHFQLFRQKHFGEKARFIPEDIAVLASDRAFDCKAAKADLNFSPRPLEEGIGEIVRLYQNDKKLN
jgi:nucleoside-diphosphate-sugar epimerase